MANRNDRGVTLRFQVVECECGDNREFGLACVSCGRLPRSTEVDTGFHRRRRLVAFTRNMIEANLVASCDEVLPGSVRDVLSAIGDDVSRLMREANNALDGTGEEGFEQFASIAARLCKFEGDCIRATTYRPYRSLRRPLVECAASFKELVNGLLGALGADTIAAAQASGRALQPALDGAADAISQAREVLSRWAAFEDSSDPLAELMRFAAAPAGGNLLGLVAFGISELERGIPSARVTEESGPFGALVSIYVSTFVDQDEFWAIANWAHELTVRNESAMRALTDQSEWRDHWSRAVSQAYWAFERFAAMNPASHNEGVARDMLDACHEIQEGLAKTVFASLRVIAKPNRTFREALADGIGSLAQWAAANGAPEATCFFVPTRNAYSHRDWRVDGSSVVLCEIDEPQGGPVTVSLEALYDHALAMQEVVLAAMLGLTVAANGAGVEVPEDGRLVSTSAAPIARAMLAGGGWTDVEVYLQDDSVEICATISRQGSLVEFGSLAHYFPGCDRMIVSAQTGSGSHAVEIDLVAMAAWAAESDADCKALAFIELLGRSTVDGSPIADVAEVRRVVAGICSRWITVTDDPKGVVQVFKRARQVAGTLGDDDLLQGVKTAQGWRWSNVHGRHRPIAQIQEFLDWGRGVPTAVFHF